MSERDHGLIEELLALRALGGLEPEDDATLRAAMAAHGDCEECLRLEAGFEETAGLLGFALESVPVREELALERARNSRPVDERRPRRRAALVAVAAALVIVLAGVASLRPRTQPIVGVSPTQEVIHFQGDAGALAMVYAPGQPGARSRTRSASSSRTGTGSSANPSKPAVSSNPASSRRHSSQSPCAFIAARRVASSSGSSPPSARRASSSSISP